jgi:hypothetical protein
VHSRPGSQIVFFQFFSQVVYFSVVYSFYLCIYSFIDCTMSYTASYIATYIAQCCGQSKQVLAREFKVLSSTMPVKVDFSYMTVYDF